MKRQIEASSEYKDFMTIQHGRQRFSVYYSFGGLYEGSFVAQVSEVHPYDDAEYAWARVKSNGQVDFIKKGKVVDHLQIPDYDEDYYEDIDDYYRDMLDTVAVNLMDMNRSVEPRMVHN